MLICWVPPQIPRLLIKRLLTSNTKHRFPDSFSVRTLLRERDRNLNLTWLKPKGILLDHVSVNVSSRSDFKAGQDSERPDPCSLSPGCALSAGFLSSLFWMALATPTSSIPNPGHGEKQWLLSQQPMQRLTAFHWVTCWSYNQSECSHNAMIWLVRLVCDIPQTYRLSKYPEREQLKRMQWMTGN